MDELIKDAFATAGAAGDADPSPGPGPDPDSTPDEGASIGLIEVPVLADAAGHTWLLPPCRLVPGVAGDLVESADLGPALLDAVADAAREQARRVGPGRHDVAFELSVGAQPRLTSASLDGRALGGWALAEELLGVDLTSGTGGILPAPEPPPAHGHAVEARVRAVGAPCLNLGGEVRP